MTATKSFLDLTGTGFLPDRRSTLYCLSQGWLKTLALGRREFSLNGRSP